MKRLLFLSCSSHVSGAERSLVAILKNIPREEYHLTLVAPAGGRLEGMLKSTCEVVNLPLLRFRRTISPFKVLYYLWNILSVSLAIRKLVVQNGVSLLVANSFSANIYSSLVRQLTNVKVAGFVRDNINVKRLSAVVLAANNRCIPVSCFISEQILCAKGKKIVAYPGLDFSTPSAIKKNFRAHQGIKESDFLIGCIAQFTPWKRHHDFIEVAQIISATTPGVHFIMAGSCLSRKDVAYRDSLCAAVERRGLRHICTILPFQEDPEPLFQALDVLIHCALREPFGRVIMESMYFGKPVIAYASGGLQEIVVHGQTGYLVPPGRYGLMAEKAIDLMTNPMRAEEMGRLGHQIAKEKFSSEPSHTINILLKSVLQDKDG